MLTRKELIAIENALGSEKASLKTSCDNKGNMRARASYNFISNLLEKIDSMIDETEDV